MNLFKQKLMKRLTITKSLGALFGIAAFCLLPMYLNEPDMMLRVGFLFWYLTLGGIIGIFGVMNYHSFIKMPMPWWFRGTFMGGWMAFVLVLFIYDDIATMLVGTGFGGLSPYFMILEGVFFGLIADYLGTKFGGEGKELLD